MQEIVIKIPEETYRDVIKNGFIYDEDGEAICHAIINGTVLPKGHGELIDRGELKEHLYACETNGRPLYVMELHERLAVIDEVETIIEADRSEE